jgi:hypothetical protein
VSEFCPSLSTVWPAHSQTIHRCHSLRSHFQALCRLTAAALPSENAMTTASPLPGERPSRCLRFPKPLLPSLLSSSIPRAHAKLAALNKRAKRNLGCDFRTPVLMLVGGAPFVERKRLMSTVQGDGGTFGTP